MPPRRQWTDEELEDEARKIATALGHFPSCSELKEMGRNDLACLMGRRGGLIHWSEKIGIPRRHSDSDTGWEGEDAAAQCLGELGFDVARRGGVKWPFDLLVGGLLRVDVKAARMATYGYCRGWFYRIAKEPQSDLILLWQLDTQDFYPLPWFLCPRTNVTISRSGGKYMPFRNNDTVIRDMLALRQQEQQRMESLLAAKAA